jgi:hypothetical protein
MGTDDVAAILAGIRERQALASDASLGFSRMEERHAALIKVAYEDTPRLVAAVEAALEAADGAIPALGLPPADCTYACDSGKCDCSGGTRAVAWNLDPAKLREAITAALTGEEAGDGK